MSSTIDISAKAEHARFAHQGREAQRTEYGGAVPQQDATSAEDSPITSRPDPRITSASETQAATQEATVVFVEERGDVRAAMRRTLEAVGYRILEAVDAKQAVSLLQRDVSVALIGQIPGGAVSRWDLLQYVRNQTPETQVLVVVDASRRTEGAAAMRQGATGFLVTPVSDEELRACISQAAYHASVERDNRSLCDLVGFPSPPVDLFGESSEIQMIRRQIKAFACLDSTVLISGARGTGKTVIAQMIHQKGARSERPLVVVPCDSLPRDSMEDELFGHIRGAMMNSPGARAGRIELAHSGTLLLDEVGLLPAELQPRLLDFIQDRVVTRIGSQRPKQVDVRIIATSSHDLAKLARQGDFNEELYYRLNVLSLHLANLKDHDEDIPMIASAILARAARRERVATPVLTDDAMSGLRRYHWPGNIRELEDVLERARRRSNGTVIRAKDVELDPSRTLNRSATTQQGCGLAGMTMAEIERAAIIETIRSTGGNKAKAARRLEVSEKTIYNKIKQYNLAGQL